MKQPLVACDHGAQPVKGPDGPLVGIRGLGDRGILLSHKM